MVFFFKSMNTERTEIKINQIYKIINVFTLHFSILLQKRREMAQQKLFLAGAAVVGGLAGYALAKTGLRRRGKLPWILLKN